MEMKKLMKPEKADASGSKIELNKSLACAIRDRDKGKASELLKAGADPKSPEPEEEIEKALHFEGELIKRHKRGEIRRRELEIGREGLYLRRHWILDLVDALVENGVTPELRIGCSGAPLLCHLAADGFSRMRVVELLLDKEADIEAKDRHGSSPLMIAAARIKPEMVELLLGRGADVNARNTNGASALMGAAACCDFRPKPNPFHLNLRFDGAYDKMFYEIIVGSAGVFPDTRPSDIAVQGSLEIAQVLLAAGADINARDMRGHSAADYAHKLGHYRMLGLLKQRGAKMPEDTKGGQGSV